MTDLSSLVGVVLAAAVSVSSPAPVTPAAAVPAHAAVWPLAASQGGAPDVAAPFDPPSHSYGAGHRGVDLVGDPGEPVRSALAGTVSFAGTVAGRGVVVVDHGSTRTTYEPVAVAVSVGARVGAGTVLGTLQAGGSHCPPRACLHWGLIAGETYLDPLSLMNLGPVRLLPVVGP